MKEKSNPVEFDDVHKIQSMPSTNETFDILPSVKANNCLLIISTTRLILMNFGQLVSHAILLIALILTLINSGDFVTWRSLRHTTLHYQVC